MLRAPLLTFVILTALGGLAQAQQSIGVVAIETGRATGSDADAAQRALVEQGTAAGANRVWSIIDGAVSAARSCTDAPCLGAIGRGHAHAYVIVLTVNRATTRVPWSVSARLVDATSNADLGMAQVEVPAGTTDWGSVLWPGLQAIVLQLPTAPLPTGSILVTSNVPGAEVFVDGNRIAQTPMEPAAVPAGPRQLRVHSARYTDFLQDIQVEPAQELRVDATLELLPPPAETAESTAFYEKPWVWGVAGGVVVVGVIVAIVIATSSGGEDSTIRDGAVQIPPLR
jgi:hypothetical protein